MFTLFHSPLEKLNEELKELEKELERLLIFIEKKSVPLVKNSKGKEIISLLKKEKKELESSQENIEKIKSPNLPLELISTNERIIKIIEAIEGILRSSKTNPFYYLSNDFLENLKRIRSYFSGEFGVIPALLKLIEKLEQTITKQKESRRKFLKLGAASGVLLFLSQLGIKPEELKEEEKNTLLEALRTRDYDRLRKILKNQSEPYTKKPKIEFHFPKQGEKIIASANPEELEYLQEVYLHPLQAVLNREKFSAAETQEAIQPFQAVISERMDRKGEIPQIKLNGIATTFVPEESFRNIDRFVARGFSLFPNHGLMQNGENLLLKREAEIPSKLRGEKGVEVKTKVDKKFSEEFDHLIAYSEDLDLALSVFKMFYNSSAGSKRGVNFTTKVTEKEPLYLIRPKGSVNYGYGALEKGEVLLTSYYKEKWDYNMESILTTLNTHAGDSGSPVFNARGEVIGMLFGGLEFKELKISYPSMVLSSRYILKFLQEAETFLSIKLKV